MLAVDPSTFNRFLHANPEAMAVWKQGFDVGKVSLRRLQFKAAEAGNVTMQIWLGKQMLQQRDKLEHTGKDGGQIEIGIEFVGVVAGAR